MWCAPPDRAVYNLASEPPDASDIRDLLFGDRYIPLAYQSSKILRQGRLLSFARYRCRLCRT